MSRGKDLLFLCGFMGVGKSTVAGLLAKRLDAEALDTDALVEKSAGLTVAAIFAKKGEPAFRQIESEVLSQLVRGAPTAERKVIALGGGTLKDPANLALVLKSGTLIYLAATVETLSLRLRDSGSTRPLLAGLSLLEQQAKISALLSERKSIYEQAPVQIQTDGKDSEAVVSEIHSWLMENAS